MQENNENKDVNEKDIEEKLKEDVERQLDEIIRENPDLTEEDIDKLRQTTKILLEQKFNQNNKGYFFKRMLSSFLISFVSALVIMGFFFKTIAVNPKWIIFIVVSAISFVYALIDSIIVITNDRRGIVGPSFLSIINPIIISVIGYIVNAYVLLIFKYHYLFPIIVILIFIVTNVVRYYLYKHIPKLRRTL